MRLVNVGFGSMVNVSRIVAILNPDSAPIRRRVQEAKESHMLVDATYGRKIRAVIIMDSDHVVVSAIASETIAARISGETKGDERTWTEEQED